VKRVTQHSLYQCEIYYKSSDDTRVDRYTVNKDDSACYTDGQTSLTGAVCTTKVKLHER